MLPFNRHSLWSFDRRGASFSSKAGWIAIVEWSSMIQKSWQLAYQLNHWCPSVWLAADLTVFDFSRAYFEWFWAILKRSWSVKQPWSHSVQFADECNCVAIETDDVTGWCLSDSETVSAVLLTECIPQHFSIDATYSSRFSWQRWHETSIDSFDCLSGSATLANLMI